MSVKYSPTEARLLKLLPHNGQRITTKQLTAKFYRNRDMPVHGQIYIANSLRMLANKIAQNREKFKLKRTPKIGPHDVEFWIE